MSPQYCLPPRVRSPVQMMISVRAGRMASATSRETTMRFALRRPFAFGASGWTGRMSPIDQRLEALDDEAVLAVEAVAEVVNEVRPGATLKGINRLHGRFLRRADDRERRQHLSFERRPPPGFWPDSDSRRRGTYRPGQGRRGVRWQCAEDCFAAQGSRAAAAPGSARSGRRPAVREQVEIGLGGFARLKDYSGCAI